MGRSERIFRGDDRPICRGCAYFEATWLARGIASGNGSMIAMGPGRRSESDGADILVRRRSLVMNRLRSLLSKYGIACSLGGLIVVGALLSEYFLTMSNLSNLARQVSINGVLAVGVTFVILAGECDFSVTAIMSVGTLLIGVTQDLPFPLVLFIALFVPTALGAVNGIITTKMRLDSFIVTLGSSTFLMGLGLIICRGRPIIIRHTVWHYFGAGELWILPIPGLIFLVSIVIGHIVLSHTVYGRYLFAIGGNEEAVRLSGVNTDFYKASTFVLSGLAAGIAGMITIGRLLLADPTFAMGKVGLDALSAVVIGGTRFGGGKGSMWGTLVGALILGIINNLFNLLNISAFYQYAFKGILVIAAIALGRESRPT